MGCIKSLLALSDLLIVIALGPGMEMMTSDTCFSFKK